MASVKGRDTRPEVTLRKALHREGFRYRVHPRGIVGRPDLVNRRRRIAVFVDGDFWHGNPADWRRRGYKSMEDQFRSTQKDRWVEKLRRNIERDQEVNARLRSEGWKVLRYWESDIREGLDAVVAQISAHWRG